MVIWRDVEGFEGLYRVSNEGVLISTPQLGVKGRVKKRSKMSNGYEKYYLYKNGKETQMSVHRLLAKHFIPNPENKPCVNHIDGNPMNNSLENLEWVTYKENAQHAIRTGLVTNIGENHTKATLTDQDVREIRDLNRHKVYNHREIGELYGVPRGTITTIVSYRNRKAAGN